MDHEAVDKLDEAWRSRGIRNRMEFFRGALGSYLKQLGAEDASALFADATATSV
jgi:metal-responsive CopG/Arc/MetJ family transcriptional regulator